MQPTRLIRCGLIGRAELVCWLMCGLGLHHTGHDHVGRAAELLRGLRSTVGSMHGSGGLPSTSQLHRRCPYRRLAHLEN